MKKLLLLFIFLFPFRVLFAQGDFTRIYHPIINSAELAIVDTNYYEALDYYKAAFDNVKKPFAKDYYNAAICAAMVGKMNTVFDYLEKIVEKGYPSDSLRKDAFFKYVADTSKVWKKFENQMRLVKPEINWVVRDSLKAYYALAIQFPRTPRTAELKEYYAKKAELSKTIYTRDGILKRSNIKISTADSLFFFGNLPENLQKANDSLQKIDDLKTLNNARLAYRKTIDLIETYGFPDETMIGLSGYNARYSGSYRSFTIPQQDFNIYIFDRNLAINILGSMPFAYDKDLTPMLIQAIRDGKIAPYQINRVGNFTLETNQANTDKTPNFYSMGNVKVLQYRLDGNLTCENKLLQGKGDKKFWKKEQLSLYSEAEINEKRLDIGLETLADAYKKAFFKAHPRVFIINGGNYQTELSYVSSCEVLEKMLKESTFVR